MLEEVVDPQKTLIKENRNIPMKSLLSCDFTFLLVRCHNLSTDSFYVSTGSLEQAPRWSAGLSFFLL